jgi:hypothetical protein
MTPTKHPIVQVPGSTPTWLTNHNFCEIVALPLPNYSLYIQSAGDTLLFQVLRIIDKNLLFHWFNDTERSLVCQGDFISMSVARDMSGFVAHDLSGLRWSPLEVTDETDRDATGDPEDAI